MPRKTIRIERVCQECGASRYYTQGRLNEKGRGTYCSKICFLSAKHVTIESALANYLVNENGCWIYQGGLDTDGYARLGTGKGYIRLSRTILGLSDPKINACHSCDNPPCIRPDHLFAGTSAQNTADRDAKKRQAFGERHWHAILSEVDVRNIRRLRATNLGPAEIARQLGMPKFRVKSVLYSGSWKYVV